MMAMNETADQACRRLLTAFFTEYPNARLQVDAYRTLNHLSIHQIPMRGKPGGWAGGIIYALANLGQRPCGVPGLLNQESEEFFHVSMDAIYKRVAQIRKLLTQ